MTDKLTLYNLALGHLSEEKLASLGETRSPRFVLDDYWDGNLAYCLERKLWNFAKRTVQIDASSTVTPAFGALYAFRIPDDWIRTVLISPDQVMKVPLLEVVEETGYWYSNVTPMFVSYTSRDPLYGLNLGAWPSSMEDYVGLRLAMRSCKRITGNADLLKGPQGLTEETDKAYKICSANCSMNDPPAYLPPGTWQKSRRGFMTNMVGPGDSPGSSLMS